MIRRFIILLKKNRAAALGLVCAVITIPILVLSWVDLGPATGLFGTFPLLHSILSDEYLRKGPSSPLREDLVLVGVDSKSRTLEELDEKEKVSSRGLQLVNSVVDDDGWPWPREVHAILLERLRAAGAKLVIFDFIFLFESDDDDLFAEALEKNKGHVVIGANYESLKNSSNEINDGDKKVLQIPAATLIPDASPGNPSVGMTTYIADADGLVRRLQFRDSIWRHSDFESSEATQLKTSYLTFVGSAVSLADDPSKMKPGFESQMFRFSKPTGTESPQFAYKEIPAYELLWDRTWEANFVSKDFFRNKIVLIGPTAATFHDNQKTPFGTMTGPQLHMQAIAAALNGDLIEEAPGWLDLILTACAGLIAWVLNVAIKNTIGRFIAMLFTFAGILVGFFYLYSWTLFLVVPSTPLFAFSLASLGAFSAEFVFERMERARTRKTLERYVSHNLVKEILDNPLTYLNAKGGTRKKVTVLFSDVRDFTTMSEGADAVQFVAQLNEYLKCMVGLVFDERGTLDKFIGDAVMAVWGNITTDSDEEEAARAVNAALAMHREIAILNAQWLERGLKKYNVGIGINFGDAIVGEIGSDEKMELTVIGDTVNTASRLEGLTKEYGVGILLGEELALQLAGRFVLRSVDVVRPKGKTLPTEIFTVLGKAGEWPEGMTEEWIKRYYAAVHKYRFSEFEEALALFEALLKERPEDSLCKLYIGRCREFLVNPPPDDWDGVWNFKSK